jgi:hypothetical protein
MKKLSAFVAFALLVLPGYSSATIISFSDPVGDHSGAVDVTGMSLDFDSFGNYTINLSATAANPFSGDFRININLWNVTQDEYFQDPFNDYSLSPSQTSLSLSGANSLIADWLVSDTIATSTLAGYGNPAGSTLFRSSVADLPFQSLCQSEDIIGYDGCTTTLPPVPVPAAAWLFGTALVGLVGFGRRRRKRPA